ncbi:hypothetical protein [Helcococcus kunzii]|uniref:hypothetical protein n=1 Tax=Helcococcus kunzii TaxID=40091 RepID=UPI0024AE4921|nr:hypothetical protein [Helcococcus kunzii]
MLNNKSDWIKSFTISMASIVLLLFVENIYSRALISIYNRHPLIVMILGLICIGTFFIKGEKYKYVLTASYYILYGMLLYRLFFEMKHIDLLTNTSIVFCVLSLIMFVVYNYITFAKRK